jgi:hypothetical protein
MVPHRRNGRVWARRGARSWRPAKDLATRPAQARRCISKRQIETRTIAMTPPKSEDGYVRMAEDEFEDLLARAAERGARRALADVGLEGKEAALDIRDLRSLIECIRFVRRTVVQTAVRLITTGILLALLAGIAIKLKLFGNGS